MKREQSAGTDISCPRAKKRAKTAHVWTQEEDQMLIREVSQLKSKNWKLISASLKNSFPGNKYTMADCKQRLRWLEQAELESHPWTPNEELLTLVAYHESGGDWETISKCIPKRREERLKEHFYGQMQDLAREMVKQGDSALLSRGPIDDLRKRLFILHFLRTIAGTSDSDEEIQAIVQRHKLKQEDCLGFLSVITHSTFWTLSKLEEYVQRVLEELQYRLSPIKQKQKKRPPIVQPLPTLTRGLNLYQSLYLVHLQPALGQHVLVYPMQFFP